MGLTLDQVAQKLGISVPRACQIKREYGLSEFTRESVDRIARDREARRAFKIHNDARVEERHSEVVSALQELTASVRQLTAVVVASGIAAAATTHKG